MRVLVRKCWLGNLWKSFSCAHPKIPHSRKQKTQKSSSSTNICKHTYTHDSGCWPSATSFQANQEKRKCQNIRCGTAGDWPIGIERSCACVCGDDTIQVNRTIVKKIIKKSVLASAKTMSGLQEYLVPVCCLHASLTLRLFHYGIHQRATAPRQMHLFVHPISSAYMPFPPLIGFEQLGVAVNRTDWQHLLVILCRHSFSNSTQTGQCSKYFSCIQDQNVPPESQKNSWLWKIGLRSSKSYNN